MLIGFEDDPVKPIDALRGNGNDAPGQESARADRSPLPDAATDLAAQSEEENRPGGDTAATAAKPETDEE